MNKQVIHNVLLRKNKKKNLITRKNQRKQEDSGRQRYYISSSLRGNKWQSELSSICDFIKNYDMCMLKSYFMLFSFYPFIDRMYIDNVNFN